VSGGHVVVVDLGIGDGHLERFMPLLLENARRSLAKEAGCLRFDVCRDAEDPSRLLLYEVYSDAAAFQAHLQSAHFRRFDTATAAMLASKQVRVLALQS